MKKIIIIVILLFGFSKSYCQSDINNYKYVVVPLQYDFLKGKNVYLLNTLTKYLFNQNGFKAYFNEENLPKDLFSDRCLAMYADVKEVDGGFRQKGLEIHIKDCYGNLMLKSSVGDSGLNNHREAYHEALREAFETFKFMDYNYRPKTSSESNSSLAPKENKKATGTVEKENFHLKTASTKKQSTSDVSGKNLIAQPFGDLNYKLNDSEGETVYVILFSGKENLYIVRGLDAVIYKLNNNWILAENLGDGVKIKAINIQFQ